MPWAYILPVPSPRRSPLGFCCANSQASPALDIVLIDAAVVRLPGPQKRQQCKPGCAYVAMTIAQAAAGPVAVAVVIKVIETPMAILRLMATEPVQSLCHGGLGVHRSAFGQHHLRADPWVARPSNIRCEAVATIVSRTSSIFGSSRALRSSRVISGSWRGGFGCGGSGGGGSDGGGGSSIVGMGSALLGTRIFDGDGVFVLVFFLFAAFDAGGAHRCRQNYFVRLVLVLCDG